MIGFQTVRILETYSPSPERRFGKSVSAVRHSIHLSGRTARSLPAFGNKNSARPCMDAIRMAEPGGCDSNNAKAGSQLICWDCGLIFPVDNL